MVRGKSIVGGKGGKKSCLGSRTFCKSSSGCRFLSEQIRPICNLSKSTEGQGVIGSLKFRGLRTSVLLEPHGKGARAANAATTPTAQPRFIDQPLSMVAVYLTIACKP